ncbi:MAG TPA: DUF456 domain-containing protein, partial [Roseimicrobium sp.]|nr:DUF456 domain-containing protein [Roseimicrobium sp.]
FGAKRMGATNRGVIGAMLGVLLGMFFSLPGILLGPFLGAMAFEMAGNRPFNEAARAGVGATLGLLAGAFGKIACCILMIVVFALNVLLRSMS